MNKAFVSLALAAYGSFSVTADTIAKWTFETSAPVLNNSSTIGGLSAEQGTGTASSFHGSPDTDYSSPAGNGSAKSFSANTWAVGDYFQLQVNAGGFRDLSVSFDQTGSGTGPRDFSLSYSLNGSAFTQFGSTYSVLGNGASPNAAWSAGTPVAAYGFSFDLSSIDQIDGSSTLYFRLTDASTVSTSGGVVGTGGTSRIDNFLVSGTSIVPVPEPTAWALFGAGVIGLGFVARRKNK